MPKKKKEIELSSQRAMLYLPEDAVKIKITAYVFMDDELKKVQRVLNMHDIQKAFKDADDNYIEDDDTFVLTEKGKFETRND